MRAIFNSRSNIINLDGSLFRNMVLLYRSMISFQWYFSNKNAYDIAYALALAANFSVYPCKVCINFPIIIHLFA